MKRFYKAAEAAEGEGGWTVCLDGRPVRTPRRAVLEVQSAPLAEAIAREWQAQEEIVRPESMPLLKLANSMLDVVVPEHERVCGIVAGYGRSDLLCYRADAPASLVRRQQQAWDPLLDWLGRRYDLSLAVTEGIVPVDQSAATLAALERVVAALAPEELTAGHDFTTLCGSLVIALALLEGELDPEGAWAAAHVDEFHQIDAWGEDEEAMARLAARRADLDSAWRFLELARAG